MREHFKQRQPKKRINKWWVIGAIAIPFFLWIVWGLSLLRDPRLQPDEALLSHNKRATLAHQHREAHTSDAGAILLKEWRWAIAMIVGGAFLFHNFRIANRNGETANFCGANFSGVDLSGTDLHGADLSSADLSGANLSGANLSSADLSGADLNGTKFRYANLSGTNLRYTNLRGADLRYANLSSADLNCAILSGANLSEANLSEALLFFINSREVLNLEPLQLKAKVSPFLCNVVLPSYSQQPDVNPNRDCHRISQLLSDRYNSDRYNISVEEAREIVAEARQDQWD